MMQIVTRCWPPGSGPAPVTRAPQGAVSVVGRVGTMGSPPLLGGKYLHLSLAYPTLEEV